MIILVLRISNGDLAARAIFFALFFRFFDGFDFGFGL